MALRITRIVIALSLFIGVAVFGIFAIQELQARQQTTGPDYGFGASDQAPALGPALATDRSPIGGPLGLDPSKYIRITRENPHPGQFRPYLDTKPLSDPFMNPPVNGSVWEHAVYKLADTDKRVVDVLGHYGKLAKKRGLVQVERRPTQTYDGLATTWTDGTRALVVTATLLPTPAPPMLPARPLRWVVKYSYPAGQDKPGR